MKAFLIVVLLFLVFVLFASSALANVDLTPNTPPVSNGVMAQAPVRDMPTAPDIIVVNGAVPPAAASQGVVPVTGAPAVCTNPYTVRSGDMLSGIAELCNTTVANIRLANPSITNINLIYPGQQLVIPGGAVAAQPVMPVTGVEVGQTIPAQPAAQIQAAPVVEAAPQDAKLWDGAQPTAAPSALEQPIVPVSGPEPMILAGTRLRVTANNYPPNTTVNIAIGPQTVGYNIVTTAQTDANGSMTTSITVPSAPDATTLWVVVVATTGQPSVQAMSRPFTIGMLR